MVDNIVGKDDEHGVRNLESRAYLGFDNYNVEARKNVLVTNMLV